MTIVLLLFFYLINDNLILQIWNWISEFGVSSQWPEENELVRLYNRMCFLSAIGVFQVMIIAWFLEFSSLYIITISLIAILYISAILLNFFHQIILTRYLISIGSPIWLCSAYLLMGGYFCQGFGIMASMAITYVVFQKNSRIQLAILIFHICCFFISSIYVNTYSPLHGVIDFPYDEITVFIGSLGWTIVVLFTFYKDRNKLLEDLKKNNLELKNTTEELERFTYIASHDLKAPLRTIISFIGLIERNINDKNYSEINDKLSFVKTGAEQMHFLVEDILELSKLKTFEKADRKLIDLNIVFEKAKQNLSQDILDRNAIIRCKKLPFFLGNELEFLILFQNFIQNGIKYNENDQPTIIISSYKTKESFNLLFKDNGIGIDEKYHELIFQYFKRLHNANEYKGTGLGLGLCKKIISNYDGLVDIDSIEGVGTTFTLTFPLTSILENKVNRTIEGARK